jgi:hypothetical protein
LKQANPLTATAIPVEPKTDKWAGDETTVLAESPDPEVSPVYMNGI